MVFGAGQKVMPYTRFHFDRYKNRVHVYVLTSIIYWDKSHYILEIPFLCGVYVDNYHREMTLLYFIRYHCIPPNPTKY